MCGNTHILSRLSLPDICDLICMILADYEVVSAHSKTEGLRRVQGGLFDLYLLDYSLPDDTGDGYQIERAGATHHYRFRNEVSLPGYDRYPHDREHRVSPGKGDGTAAGRN